jgi:regulator of protease activity HflC (stomatin/prohibitin superfamily)
MRTVYGPIYTLRPFERGIQETLGKYNRFVMPGLGFQIPFIHHPPDPRHPRAHYGYPPSTGYH